MLKLPTPFGKRIQRSILLVSGVCFLGACANITPPCAAKNTPPAAELKGTHWELSRWNLPPNAMGEVRLRSLPNDQGQKIQLQFSGNRMSGYSACNRFTAQIAEDTRGFQINHALMKNGMRSSILKLRIIKRQSLDGRWLFP
ncbi:MAG: META domain-containing protein [Burkholderiaceae bacterium]|nr:META domain-containing protein [Burkholderiaceae bacterium]